MALTLTEQFRADLGGRKWRFFHVTHDESTSTIAAASLDLTYIDYFDYRMQYIASDAANTSILALYNHASINATHSTLTMGLPAKANSIAHLMVIGW